jgi:hypothetical protein
VATYHTRTRLTLNRPHLASVHLYSYGYLTPERNQLHATRNCSMAHTPQFALSARGWRCRSSNLIRVSKKPAGGNMGCPPSPTGTPQTHLPYSVVYPEVCPWEALYDYLLVPPLTLVYLDRVLSTESPYSAATAEISSCGLFSRHARCNCVSSYANCMSPSSSLCSTSFPQQRLYVARQAFGCSSLASSSEVVN